MLRAALVLCILVNESDLTNLSSLALSCDSMYVLWPESRTFARLSAVSTARQNAIWGMGLCMFATASIAMLYWQAVPVCVCECKHPGFGLRSSP